MQYSLEFEGYIRNMHVTSLFRITYNNERTIIYFIRFL